MKHGDFMGFLLDLPMENGDLMGLFMGFIYETWGILWDFTLKYGGKWQNIMI